MCGKLPRTSELHPKPPVMLKLSPNFSSRNNSTINQIIIHYSSSPSIHETMNAFNKNESRSSCHYLIGRFGEVYQLVYDDHKAWHTKKNNAHSIGVELVAVHGEEMSSDQNIKTMALIKFLVCEYKIEKSNIIGHCSIDGEKTLCPGYLFGQDRQESLRQWVDENI